MKVITLLPLLVAMVMGASPPVWKELFTMDCNGVMHIMDSSGFPISFSMPLIQTAYNFGVDQIKTAVECKCPVDGKSLSEQEFARRFVPGASAVLNGLKGNASKADFTDTCPFSNFERTWGAINFLEFDLPSTCTLESWESGKSCFMQYKVRQDFDATVQLAVDKCPNTYLPYISVTCSGDGCNNFAKPCMTSDDCDGTLECYALHSPGTTVEDMLQQFFEGLTDMYIYDSKDKPNGCYNSLQVINYLENFVYGHFVKGGTLSTVTDAKLCGFNYNSNFDDDFKSCVATNVQNPDACSLDYDYTTVTCPNTQPWDGTLSDGSSAIAKNRKDGSAFSKFNFPKKGDSTSDQLTLLTTSCDGIITMLGTEKIGFSVGFDYSPIVDAFVDLLKKTQQCRFTPGLNATQYRLSWNIWDPVFWANMFTTSGVPLPTAWSSFFTGFSQSMAVSSLLDLPSSCSVSSYLSTGECALQWTGLQDLFNVNVTIRMKISACKDNGLPNIYIDCDGADCTELMRPKLCTQNSDCSGNLACGDMLQWSTLTYKNYNPLGLLLWGQSNPADGHTCPNEYFEWIDPKETCQTDLTSYNTMLRNGVTTLTGEKSSVNTGFKVCTIASLSTIDGNTIEQWAKSMVMNNGANFKIKGLKEWKGAFVDPTTRGNHLSGGAKAGIAIGVLGAVAAAVIVFVVVKRRRSHHDHREQERLLRA